MESKRQLLLNTLRRHEMLAARSINTAKGQLGVRDLELSLSWCSINCMVVRKSIGTMSSVSLVNV